MAPTNTLKSKKRWWACLLALFTLVLVAGAQEPPKSSLIDSTQLLSDLRTLSSDSMEGRQTGTAGAEKAQAFIRERFKAAGISPFATSYDQEFTFTGRGTVSRRGVNVIGHIDGQRQARRYIVISAHYDHLGTINGQVFNGADDNASGVAALFALGKYFSAHPPANSLIFAAFDAEEVGLRGSQAFLRQPPVQASALALNINADMIGRELFDRLFVVGTARQPFLRTHVDAVARKAPLKLLVGHEDPKQPEDWTADSDHYIFMQAGIPALYVGVEDFTQHHKATDDYETMSYSFYVRAVETLVQLIEQFDSNLDGIGIGTGRNDR